MKEVRLAAWRMMARLTVAVPKAALAALSSQAIRNYR